MTDAAWKNPLKDWFNEPHHKATIKGAKIIFTVPKGTDCYYDENRRVNNAPFYWQKASGDFQVIVHIKGTLTNDSDKAGIMMLHDDHQYIFTGVEKVEDTILHSTSVTNNDMTDWSMAEMSEYSPNNGVWMCFKRVGDTYECFHSFNGRKWVQTRQGTFSGRPVVHGT
jgi:regulation of enolase protein 1 (concanavalin A-like superfamily)